MHTPDKPGFLYLAMHISGQRPPSRKPKAPPPDRGAILPVLKLDGLNAEQLATLHSRIVHLRKALL
jgi:hypothetical protein